MVTCLQPELGYLSPQWELEGEGDLSRMCSCELTQQSTKSEPDKERGEDEQFEMYVLVI